MSVATEPFLLLHRGASMEQAADGAETAAIDGLVSSWSENISVSFCLRSPGYGLTLWCALGLLVGDAIQVPQLQLQLQLRDPRTEWTDDLVALQDGVDNMTISKWRQCYPMYISNSIISFCELRVHLANTRCTGTQLFGHTKSLIPKLSDVITENST